MNFKILFILSLISFSSCGVKSDPVPPSDSYLPSYPDQFINSPKEEKKKKKKL